MQRAGTEVIRPQIQQMTKIFAYSQIAKRAYGQPCEKMATQEPKPN